MLQTAPQFTPFQLLEAARRAEADGHIEAAFQFYRQTADQFAYSPEAAEAREGLARLTSGWQPKIWHLNGGAPAPSEAGGRGAGGARKTRRSKYPAVRKHYRIGRWVAGLVSLLGWAVLLGGAGVPTVSALLGRPELGMSNTSLVGLGGGLILLGLVLVVLGLAFRALFDQANATRELVAIERLKAGLE